MTLWAQRSASGRVIEVHAGSGAGSGSVKVTVSEDEQHVRHFWSSLGQLLANPDGKTHGQHAYEAYHASCGGKSVHGEDLPGWDDQAEAIREHWEAAANAAR